MAGKKGNVHDSKEIKWHNMEMAGKENISIKEGTHNFEISVAILEITMRLRVTKTTEGHVCTNSRLHNTGLFVSTAHFILFLAYHIIVIEKNEIIFHFQTTSFICAGVEQYR
ncbi:hypothetical protein ACJX0J_040702, partial [Zea mays]